MNGQWRRHWPDFAITARTKIGPGPGWDEFATMLQARLATGYREYGDGSFARDPSDLSGEVAQEYGDVSGWSFIQWCVGKSTGDVVLMEAAMRMVLLGYDGWCKARADATAWAMAAE